MTDIDHRRCGHGRSIHKLQSYHIHWYTKQGENPVVTPSHHIGGVREYKSEESQLVPSTNGFTR